MINITLSSFLYFNYTLDMVICQEKMLLGKEEHQLSFYIQLGWDVELVGDVFSVLFTLSDAFGQEIFDLSVHRSKVVFRPRRNRFVELGG